MSAVAMDNGVALGLSNLPQTLDGFVWAILAIAVFPQTIFQSWAPATALAASLAIWLLAYPVMAVAARCFVREGGAGSAVQLAGARVLLGISTAAVAFMPGEGHAVLAPCLLIACRLGQGLAMGALARRGLVSVNGGGRALGLTLGVLLGLTAAAGILGALAAVLQGPDFLAWGWRYPFVLAIPVNMVALFVDLRLPLPAGERRGLRLVSSLDAPVGLKR
jgi:hypothetical protein